MKSSESSNMLRSRNLTRNVFLFLQLIFAIALIMLIKQVDERTKQVLQKGLHPNGSNPGQSQHKDYDGVVYPVEPTAREEEPKAPEPEPQGGDPVPGVPEPPQEGEQEHKDKEQNQENKAQQEQNQENQEQQEQNPPAPPEPAAFDTAFETCPWPGQDGSKFDDPCQPTDPIRDPWFPQGAGAGNVNLLELPCPPYDRHFKAPCWKEWVNITKEDIWKDSKYRHLFIEGKNVSEKFDTMETFWGWRTEDPSRHWRVRCLPYYFIVGLPKCATTDLYVRINFNKEIREPFVKEPQWWETNRFEGQGYFKEPASIHDYMDLYDMAGLEFLAHQPHDKCGIPSFPSITGDASTWTFTRNTWWRQLPENDANSDEPKYILAHYIRRLIPQARIIIMMRDPTERLYSDYLFFRLGAKTPEAFHTWATKAVDTFNSCLSTKSLRACIYSIDEEIRDHLVVGLYYPFMSEWLSLFPREQVLVIHFELDYVQQQLDTLKNTVKFLGVRPYTEDELKWHYDRPTHNTRREEDRKAGSMLNGTRTLLDNFYKPYNQKLAQLLNDDRFLWNH